jgi:hypothetical protein
MDIVIGSLLIIIGLFQATLSIVSIYTKIKLRKAFRNIK